MLVRARSPIGLRRGVGAATGIQGPVISTLPSGGFIPLGTSYIAPGSNAAKAALLPANTPYKVNGLPAFTPAASPVSGGAFAPGVAPVAATALSQYGVNPWSILSPGEIASGLTPNDFKFAPGTDVGTWAQAFQSADSGVGLPAPPQAPLVPSGYSTPNQPSTVQSNAPNPVTVVPNTSVPYPPTVQSNAPSPVAIVPNTNVPYPVSYSATAPVPTPAAGCFQLFGATEPCVGPIGLYTLLAIAGGGLLVMSMFGKRK